MSLLSPEMIDEAGVLFHDVRPEDIDAIEHATFVIERVLDRGTMRSVAALVKLYGEPRIRAFFVEGGSQRVSRPTASLWQSYFGLTERECTPTSSLRIKSPYWKP